MCAKRRATRPHTVPVRDKSMVTRPQKRTTRMKRGSGSMVTAITVESKAISADCWQLPENEATRPSSYQGHN